VEAEFYNPREVAALLKLPLKTVQGYIARGELGAARFGKAYRVSRRDLDAFIQSAYPGGPARPPQDEVLALFRECLPVTEHDEVAAWLRSEGLRPEAIRILDLARALPSTQRLPEWVHTPIAEEAGRGPLLVLPLWDAAGELRSLRAHPLSGAASAAETGGDPHLLGGPSSGRGLVMAEMISLALLRHPSIPPEDHGYAVETVRRSGLWIALEEKAFLSLGTEWKVEAERPGVIGVLPGGWTEDFVTGVVPDGCTVTVLSPRDLRNESYADLIAQTFEASGLTVQRRAVRARQRG
jgi:excisionase family DNA binding protein